MIMATICALFFFYVKVERDTNLFAEQNWDEHSCTTNDYSIMVEFSKEWYDAFI